MYTRDIHASIFRFVDLADPDAKEDLLSTESLTVPVNEDADELEKTCPICNEEFDQFYKQDSNFDEQDGR